jgi:hypothetical protein
MLAGSSMPALLKPYPSFLDFKKGVRLWIMAFSRKLDR